MKYLLTCRPIEEAAPPREAVAKIRASMEWIEARLADGSMESTYLFPERGGIAIMNADSHDDLMKLLLDYPALTLYQWDIRPLADWRTGFETVIKLLERRDE